LKFGDRFSQVRLTNDCVAAIHRLGQVAGEFHGDTAGHSSAFQVADSGPPEVVDDAAGYACGDASLLSGTAKVFDGSSILTAEHPRRNNSPLLQFSMLPAGVLTLLAVPA